jgi:hypothetical protein
MEKRPAADLLGAMRKRQIDFQNTTALFLAGLLDKSKDHEPATTFPSGSETAASE